MTTFSTTNGFAGFDFICGTAIFDVYSLNSHRIATKNLSPAHKYSMSWRGGTCRPPISALGLGFCCCWFIGGSKIENLQIHRTFTGLTITNQNNFSLIHDNGGMSLLVGTMDVLRNHGISILEADATLCWSMVTRIDMLWQLIIGIHSWTEAAMGARFSAHPACPGSRTVSELATVPKIYHFDIDIGNVCSK